jgi:DnaJ family protein C protein 27
VEIPADPSSLSVKELKELLSALGIDHEGCLEKADLLALVQKRKEKRHSDSGNGETTPRASAGAGKPPAASRASSKDAAGAAAGPTVRPSEMKEPRALRVKVMSLGSAAAGKSTLIKRYCEGRFVQKYICTIGIDYGVKPVKVLGHDIKVNFFDTSGGAEFQDIRTEFYEQGETRGFLLVYDVTNKKSFSELDDWLDESRRYKCPLSKMHRSGDLPYVILCANKVDLPKRVVTAAEGQAFAARHGMFYYETSAATGESVVEAMNFLFEQIVQRHNHDRKRLGAG